MLKRKINFNVEDYIKDMESSPMFSTKGVVTFKPERKGLKSKNACCVIEVDEGILEYYRNQIKKEYGLELLKPSWSAHISIIQGSIDPESEIYQKAIKNYEGLNVNINYSIFPRFNGDTSKAPNDHKDGLFWFLTVEAPIFNRIRTDLNLSTSFRPHLTIGKNPI